jgi:4-amino-4-deoxy-L-arabinose transferase-like glycosyltransferase
VETDQANISPLARAPATPPSLRRRSFVCAALALLFFCAVAPTLAWLDFSSGSENLNVATVTEMRRDGGGIKLVPTLHLRPRMNKPPLTAWITASFVPPDLVQKLASADPAERAAAQRALAWRARLPALLAACGIVVGTYLLAELLAGPALALLAALACATTLTLLRQSRLSTTDIQLALWVTVANAFIARGLLRGMTWGNCVAAGLTLALALMSKGPVALVQTLAPAAVWLAWTRWTYNPAKPPPRIRYMYVLAGLVVMVAGGTAWFVYVLARESGGDLLNGWFREVTREGATMLPSSDWYNYVSIFASVFPWTAFFIVGLVLAWQALARRRRQPLLMAFLLLVVPILIMSLFRDRKERYLLPMVGPAAIVIAWGLREHLRNWDKWSAEDATVTVAHWISLAVLAVGVPVAGAIGIEAMRTVDGRPWYTPAFGAAAGVVMAALVAGGAFLHLRWRGALVTVTVVVMLLLQVMVVAGYRDSRDGMSVMKGLADTIRDVAPDAPVINLTRNRTVPPADLAIYLPRPIPTERNIPEPDGRPMVVLLYQRREEPVPKRPPGFERLARATEKSGRTWHAFLRR